MRRCTIHPHVCMCLCVTSPLSGNPIRDPWAHTTPVFRLTPKNTRKQLTRIPDPYPVPKLVRATCATQCEHTGRLMTFPGFISCLCISLCVCTDSTTRGDGLMPLVWLSAWRLSSAVRMSEMCSAVNLLTRPTLPSCITFSAINKSQTWIFFR